MPIPIKRSVRLALLLLTLAACSEAFHAAPAWELVDAPRAPQAPPPAASWRAEIYARRDALGLLSLTSSAQGVASLQTTYRLLELRAVFDTPPPSSDLVIWVEGSGIARQRLFSWTLEDERTLTLTIPQTSAARLMWLSLTIQEDKEDAHGQEL